METEDELLHKYIEWANTSLESLVFDAINSDRGVSHSRYTMNGRTAALVIAVHPKIEPWKGRAKHYFDENQGNNIDSIRGATLSLILNHAFDVAAQGASGVLVIYNPQVVIIASFIENQIKALERDYLWPIPLQDQCKGFFLPWNRVELPR